MKCCHAILILLGVLLASCRAGSSPAVSNQATGTPVPAPGIAATLPQPLAAPSAASTENAAIRAAIQETLDRYSEAYTTKNSALLDTTYDRANPPLRRLFQERFTAYQDSVLGGVVIETYRLQSLRPLADAFVLATVVRSSDDFVADWTFKAINGRWLLAEPSEEQVGKRVKTERGGITFYTYPWNDALKEALINGMLAARAAVKAKLGVIPDRPLEVVVRPIFGVGGIEAGVPTAYYTTTGRDEDRLVIYGPQSFAFVFYDPTTGWEHAFTSVLTHEYTHLVTNRSFVSLSLLSSWMSEGIAEYTRDKARPQLVRAALERNRLIPIQAAPTIGGTEPRDLDHLDALGADRYLGYGLAYELVAYIVERHGGLEGFWRLCRTYAKNVNNLDGALQASFGISYVAFDTDWQTWLRQRYGS